MFKTFIDSLFAIHTVIEVVEKANSVQVVAAESKAGWYLFTLADGRTVFVESYGITA